MVSIVILLEYSHLPLGKWKVIALFFISIWIPWCKKSVPVTCSIFYPSSTDLGIWMSYFGVCFKYHVFAALMIMTYYKHCKLYDPLLTTVKIYFDCYYYEKSFLQILQVLQQSQTIFPLNTKLPSLSVASWVYVKYVTIGYLKNVLIFCCFFSPFPVYYFIQKEKNDLPIYPLGYTVIKPLFTACSAVFLISRVGSVIAHPIGLPWPSYFRVQKAYTYQ